MGGFPPIGLAVAVGVICAVGVSAGCLVGGDAVEARSFAFLAACQTLLGHLGVRIQKESLLEPGDRLIAGA